MILMIPATLPPADQTLPSVTPALHSPGQGIVMGTGHGPHIRYPFAGGNS
jgi:hypothetical protein